jgi:hypothetical protein
MFLAVEYPDIQEPLAQLVASLQTLSGAESQPCYFNLDYGKICKPCHYTIF